MMNVDLHVHTLERSPCATVNEEYQINAAIQAGLDGIAITDHDKLVPRERLAVLNERYAPFKIFTGIEISAGHNDWLVLGMHDLALEQRNWFYPDLLEFVRIRGGYIILAHPFRHGPDLQVDLDAYPPDGIEVMSSNTPVQHQAEIRALAAGLGLALFSNSDAHRPGTIGAYCTRLPRLAADDRDLIKVLNDIKTVGENILSSPNLLEKFC